LKLKPDNPLALVMRSMLAASEKEPPEVAARYLLQGISEAREALPSMTIPAVNNLLRTLAVENKISMVGFWCEFLDTLLRNNESEDDSLQKEPSINLLAKTSCRVVPDPPGAAWKERMAEVNSLASTFRFQQAETKVRAILRDFPDQPGPLSFLLRAQQAQLDQEGAYATAKKLSDNPQLSPKERDYFLALAYLMEVGERSLCTPILMSYCEVDSDERIHGILDTVQTATRVTGEEDEQSRQYFASLVNDEVPAKRVYSISDKFFVDPSHSETLPPPPADPMNCELARFIATIVTFGKQTDRPARVLIIGKCLPEQRQILEQLKDSLNLGPELELANAVKEVPYGELLRLTKVVVESPLTGLTFERQGKELVEDFLACPIGALGNLSPMQAAQEERHRAALRALLLHLEGEQSLVVPQTAIGEIYKRLEIERPTLEFSPTTDRIPLGTLIDLDRLDAVKLSDNQLQATLAMAIGIGALRVYYHCSKEVLNRPALTAAPVRVAALSGMMSFEQDLDQKIKYSVELEEAIVSAGGQPGKIIIDRFMLLQSLRRLSDAQKCLMEATKKYPSDPYILSFIQYAMEQSRAMQGARAMDPIGQRMEPDSVSSGGLVLPGQSESSESKGKLWIPGT
jgi:hypothetical protein